jgi:ADP-ribose pyrophosphatase YjhB (NUDIX family)
MMLHQVKLVADVCVLAAGAVLLVKYSDTNKYDHQRGWFLPDDYLQALEHPQDAGLRILQEQCGWTGLSADRLQHGDIESFKGGDGSWHLIFHLRLQLAEKPQLKLDANVAEAAWFALDALPDKKEVAHHGWALATIRELTGSAAAGAES